MKTRILVVLTCIAVMTTSSCLQIQQALQLAKCEFRLKDVSNLTLAGVNVQQIESWSDINLVDVAKITLAFKQGTLPVNFKLNTEIRNPNSATAALNQLDWILMLDQGQIAEGTTTQRVEVPAGGGTAIMPLTISTDLKKLFGGESLSSLANMVLSMADASGKPTKLTLKAKPYIVVGSTTIPYPGYINVKTDFVSQ